MHVKGAGGGRRRGKKKHRKLYFSILGIFFLLCAMAMSFYAQTKDTTAHLSTFAEAPLGGVDISGMQQNRDDSMFTFWRLCLPRYLPSTLSSAVCFHDPESAFDPAQMALPTTVNMCVIFTQSAEGESLDTQDA